VKFKPLSYVPLKPVQPRRRPLPLLLIAALALALIAALTFGVYQWFLGRASHGPTPQATLASTLGEAPTDPWPTDIADQQPRRRTATPTVTRTPTRTPTPTATSTPWPTRTSTPTPWPTYTPWPTFTPEY